MVCPPPTRQLFFSALLLTTFVGWLPLSITGCSKGQIKLTETEQQIQKIDTFLLGLEEVYGKKDLATLKSYFSSQFQDQHPELFQAVQKAFEVADRVQMDLTVDLIHIDGQKVKVLLHWDVNSLSAQADLQYRGNATLQLIEEQETLQIIALEGDNPFSLGHN
jgi:hypothetical protein